MDTILKKNLINGLGLDSLSETDQAKMVEEIGRVVYERIMSRVIPILSQTERDEFQKIIEASGDDDTEIFNYLNSKVPNLEAIVQEEVRGFKETSLNVMSQIG